MRDIASDVISLTRQLVDIPSVTGQEREIGDFLFDLLSDEGWTCTRQSVTAERFNLLALQGQSPVLLTTHIDTVPDFFPSSENENFVYGRGACDAKGIAASMICAAQELSHQGVGGVGLLFVIGEETDSIGATKAKDLKLDCSFIINGEPTDNELAVGHKGIVHACISVEGVAAHSAYPELGESAIEKLMDFLSMLRQTTFPSDAHLGKSHLNIGKIRGGKAINVTAASAQAEILIRTVTKSERYIQLLQRLSDSVCNIEILKTSEPQKMEAVKGFPTKVVGYGTDIPVLRKLGRPLLFGPGSILEAHTVQEKISKQQLSDAVKHYQTLARELLI